MALRGYETCMFCRGPIRNEGGGYDAPAFWIHADGLRECPNTTYARPALA